MNILTVVVCRPTTLTTMAMTMATTRARTTTALARAFRCRATGFAGHTAEVYRHSWTLRRSSTCFRNLAFVRIGLGVFARPEAEGLAVWSVE